jgi:hypothetical protein
MNSTFAEALCEAPVDTVTEAMCQINTNVDNLVYCLNSFFLVVSVRLQKHIIPSCECEDGYTIFRFQLLIPNVSDNFL